MGCCGRDTRMEALSLALRACAMIDVLIELQENLGSKPSKRQGETKCARCNHLVSDHGRAADGKTVNGCNERVCDAAGDMDWCWCNEEQPGNPKQLLLYPVTTEQRKEFADMAYALEIIAHANDKPKKGRNLFDRINWNNDLLHYDTMTLILGHFKKAELEKAAIVLKQIGDGIPLADYMEPIKFLSKLNSVGLWKNKEGRCF